MATMSYLGQTYTIKYVDPGATGTNDGSTEANALTTMPTMASMTTANICFLVRRTVTELAWTVGTCSVNNIIVMGCPLAADMLADLVPSATMTAWGADTPTQAILLTSSATAGCIFSGSQILISRLEVRSPTGAGTNSAGTIQLTNANSGGLMDCIIKVKSADITDGTRSTLVRVGLALGGNNPFVVNCEIHGSCAIPWDILNTTRGMVNPKIINTTFKWWDQAAAFNLGGTTTQSYALLADNCTFWFKGSATGFTHGCWGDVVVFRNCTFKQDTDKPASTGTCIFGQTITSSEFINCTFTFQQGATGNTTIFDTFLSLTLINCTVTLTASATPTSGGAVGFGSSVVNLYLKDSTISIDGFNSVALDTSSIVLQHLENTTFSKGRINTMRKIKIASLDLSNLAASVSTFGVVAQKAAQVYIQTLTVAGSGRTVQIQNASDIFIDSVPFALNLDFNTTDERGAYYCLNEAGITGNFHAESLRNKITTSSTYRTGSAGTWSYKFEGKTAASSTVPYLYVAPRPYSGIILANATTGRKSVTMFIAYKNYTVGINDLILELEVPNGASGTATKVITSQTHGYILTDTSTWNNDTGLTIMKIVVIFTADRAENINARIAYNKYTASAYVYADPTLALASA